MRSRHNGNTLLRHVDSESQTGLVNVGETLLNEFQRLMSDIQKHTLGARALDLGVNGTRHDIARRQ